MSKVSYIPSRDGDFNSFQIDFVNAVNTNHVAWGITPTEVTALTDAQVPWTAAWEVAKNKANRTRAQIAAKTLARKDYTAVLRPFIQARIYRNPLMTDADLLLCGVRPHDHTRTTIGKPTGTPVVTVAGGMGNGMAFYFSPPKAEDGSTHRGKPDGVTGLIVAMQVGGDTAPKNPESCSLRVLVSRSPKRFNFPPDNIGQKVYFFACWVNGKGEQGPWTAIQQFILT